MIQEKKRSAEYNWDLEELWFPSLKQVQALLGDQEYLIFTAQKAIDWLIIYSLVM